MRRLACCALALAVLICNAQPVPAQDTPAATELSQVSAFNRELVDKVKKSCVYIWAMAAGEWGFNAAAWIGSGVIFMAVPEENAAYALTNHHVANSTTLLQVETWDRATYKARLVATEPGIDCALIRIEGIPRDRYEPCVLGNSDEIVFGEPALAVGAPGSAQAVNTERMDPMMSWGLHQSTTMRVVSGRQTDPYSFIVAWAYWQGPPLYLGMQVMTNCPWRMVMQAPISGGNSGGPLFNAQGEVIGLNHAHFGPGAQISQHENYTIPINFCKNFAFQILSTGKYEVPWLGLDMLIPQHYKQPSQVFEFVERYLDPEKLEILDVRGDSPAERAGLQRGDLILEFDGRTFADIIELRLYVFQLPVGKDVSLTVKRGRQELDFVVTVGPKRKYDSEFSL
jgi:S1-C subfamily serine protease